MQEATTKICRYCNAVCDLQDTFCGRCGRPFLMAELSMATSYIEPTQSASGNSTLSNTVPAGTPPSSSPFTTQAPPPPPLQYQPQRRRPTKYFVMICVLLALVIGGVGVEIGRLSKSGSAQSLIPGDTTMHQQATPVPPQPGTVLYQENGSDNWKNWSGSADWKVLNGTLINDGTYSTNREPPTITAPYQVAGTANYAVEAKIRVLRQITGQSLTPYFGISFRGTSSGDTWHGYWATVIAPNSVVSQSEAYIQNNNFNSFTQSVLAQTPFDPSTIWHTYRVEVSGNDIKLLIDGALKLDVQDNQFITGAQVGFGTTEEELIISSFKITAL